MINLFRLFWKLLVLAGVFGVGYIIGREHSFEEDEEWEDEENNDEKTKSENQTSDTGVSGVEKDVYFELADEKASSVSVVGDFNDWNKDKTQLVSENGVWKCSVKLKPGRHEYKFVVNETDWIVDPKCPENVADKYGGKSSVVSVA